MAFRLTDVKKTMRTRSDGHRYLHPKLLDITVVEAQVALAQAYMAARVGRARHEVDPEMLVRFFGDAKVARGLVACLAAAYHWRTLTFGEVLDAPALAALTARELYTPSDLRLSLFNAMNATGHGYLSLVPDRETSLRPLARRLRVTPDKLDQLVALDAEENAVLVRVGAVPSPAHVVALYNHYVLDAVLRNSVSIELERVEAGGRAALDAACATWDVGIAWRGQTAWLHNRADSFGSYARSGARLVRALYIAAAAEPGILAHGQAQVHPHGHQSTTTALYQCDASTLRALTGGTGRVYHAPMGRDFRDDWDRVRTVHGGTAGWRLLSAPEPLLTARGLALAPYAVRRDEAAVLLWPVVDSDHLRDAIALHETGLSMLVVGPAELANAIPPGLPWATQEDGAAGVLSALDASWSRRRVSASAQALDALLDALPARRFIPEAEVCAALNCTVGRELTEHLRGLDPDRGIGVPGVGLCSPDFAAEMRRGLRRRRASVA